MVDKVDLITLREQIEKMIDNQTKTLLDHIDGKQKINQDKAIKVTRAMQEALVMVLEDNAVIGHVSASTSKIIMSVIKDSVAYLEECKG